MLLRKKTILLVFVLFISIPAFSQGHCTGVFRGRITDVSGTPLAGAAILLMPGQSGRNADADGRFIFNNLCEGTYKVTAQFLGYKTVTFEITGGAETERTIKLEQEAENLEEVVVQDKPISTGHAQNFTTLTEQQLAATAGKTLGEALKEVPGVNSIQSGPGIFKPVIHGVHSQRILILNYGIRQEGQQWGAEHAPEIDPFIASNIVVVKDASAIKYGTDALGGVVIVNPPALPTGADGLGGSFNTVLQSNGRSGTVSGELEGGIKNHNGWGWRVQGTAKRSGDFQSPHYSLTNTGIKEYDFSAATGYHAKNYGVEVFFSHFQTELGILKGTSIGNIDDLVTAMERSEPAYTSDFSYDITEPRQEVKHNLLKLNAHMATERGEWRVQYGFQNDHRKEFDIRIGSLSGIPAINLQLNTHTLDVERETTLSEKVTTTFGVNGMYQNNQNIFGTQRIPFIPNFKNLSTGAFALTRLTLNNWVVDAGIRYDYRAYDVSGYDYKNTLYKDNLSFHNVSASGGATVQLGNNNSLALNLSSAWRPPHVAELYSLGTHQSAAAIEYGLLLNDTTNEVMNFHDVSFRNEQAVKWVSTYQQQIKQFRFEATAYANYIFNYIYLRATGITQNVRGTYPYFRYTQTDALFLGLDLSGTWQASQHFSVNPKASLLCASDERNNDYLVFIPANRYEVAVRYEMPEHFVGDNFYVEGKVKYVAKQNRAPRVVTVREIKEAHDNGEDPFANDHSNFDFMAAPDAYALCNLSSGFSIKTKHGRYDLRLSVENMFNTTYREYTNRFRYYADDMGRNFLISAKYIF